MAYEIKSNRCLEVAPYQLIENLHMQLTSTCATSLLPNDMISVLSLGDLQQYTTVLLYSTVLLTVVLCHQTKIFNLVIMQCNVLL